MNWSEINHLLLTSASTVLTNKSSSSLKMSLRLNKSKITAASMRVQGGQNLYECNSHLARDETGILQIAPPRMATFLSWQHFAPAKYICAPFGLHGKSFSCYIYSWSHDQKVGSLVVVDFNECFVTQSESGALLRSLCPFLIKQQTVCLALRHIIGGFFRRKMIIFATLPLWNFMVHCLCGALTNIWPPIW